MTSTTRGAGNGRRVQPSRFWFGPPSGPSVANPTVWLFAVAASLVAAGSLGYLLGRLPVLAATPVNALGLYLGFTVLHDGVHGVVHRRRRTGTWMARFWGYLLTFTYPFFLRIHQQHHAAANDPERDPDHVNAHLPAVLIPLLGGFFVFASYQVHYFRRRLWKSRAELAEVVGCDLSYLAIVAAAFAGGWTAELAALWIVPLTLTILFLVLTFDFLPHRPHDSSDPYFASRAYGGALTTLALCGQNYHLVHHLWPGIPWFRYRRAFLEVRDDLTRRGCRVGWRIGPLPGADPAPAATDPAPEVTPTKRGGRC